MRNPKWAANRECWCHFPPDSLDCPYHSRCAYSAIEDIIDQEDLGLALHVCRWLERGGIQSLFARNPSCAACTADKEWA